VPGLVPIINHLMLQNADALAEAIAGSDVVLTLAGHVHHPTTAVFAGALCASGMATAYMVDPLTHGEGFRGVEGAGFTLVQLYGRTVVTSAVLLPTEQRELYYHALTEEQLRRWMTPAAAAALALTSDA
jgi:hypothetical protein